MHFPRILEKDFERIQESAFSLFLLGPRQTGKSTLIESYLKKVRNPLIFRLQESKTFEEIQKNPSVIFQATEALLEKQKNVTLFIDEIQLVPILLGDCQSLIDRYKERLQVFLTGSSARKLRREGVNLLPGRVIRKNLHPLIFPEFLKIKESYLFPQMPTWDHDFQFSLQEILIFGNLPGVLTCPKDLKQDLLYSYVSSYLQEEIRAEALARHIGHFAKFLELAAFESGSRPNYSKLSNESGIPVSTIQNYFDILEDTLIIFRVPPFSKPGRKKTLSTPRYYFYDLGIRNAAANLALDPNLLKIDMGALFENFIVLELIRRIDYLAPKSWKYSYWRTTNDLEVDFIIETPEEIIPIEIKAATVPREKHIKHLKIFMKDYGVKRGYLVGQFSRPQKLTENITAIPWNVL